MTARRVIIHDVKNDVKNVVGRESRLLSRHLIQTSEMIGHDLPREVTLLYAKLRQTMLVGQARLVMLG
jgi:hypothetical protein